MRFYAKWQMWWITLVLGASPVQGRELPPCAAQLGPSCAFFANVPALTLYTGVDISSSVEFIRPIYGLHRGDFQFQRSFHKKKFFELFSIPYHSKEVAHPALSKPYLLRSVEQLIAEVFDPGLQQGHLFSLRSIGVFGGPHNILLLSRNGEKYQVHDPFPGVIRTFTRAELAAKILIASSKTKNDLQPRYVTHYLTILTSSVPMNAVKKLNQLPPTLQITLTETQRKSIQKGLQGSAPVAGNDGLASMVQRFPSLDFAALPPDEGGKTFVNAIDPALKNEKLLGVIRLAQFHLNVWHIGHRPHLSVLFLQDTPQVLVGYKQSAQGLSLVFDDGVNTKEYGAREALEMLSKKEAVHATLKVAHEAKEPTAR